MRGPFEPIGKCAVVVLSFLYSVRYRWGEAPAEFTAPLHFPAVLSTTCTSHTLHRGMAKRGTWRFDPQDPAKGRTSSEFPRGAVGNNAGPQPGVVH